jgi:NAD(P)-dependent dehydrogenase (short-subunit alcohol dehydrogenase family)
MSGRLADKVAIVVGAGQTPGDTIGNGRATAILFAREGARVVCVDLDLERARETVERIEAEGGLARAVQADATREDDCPRIGAIRLFDRMSLIGEFSKSPLKFLSSSIHVR